MPVATKRETPDLLEARLQTSVAGHPKGPGERELLEHRLASVERANAELVDRLRRHEAERAEVRARLGHILALMGMV
jgi:hypothetical protein